MIEDRARLEKFLGMLGSAHAGEACNAASMILKMAQSQKMTIAELCLGTAKASREPPHSGEAYWRQQYNITRQKADRLEREIETLKKELGKKASNKFDFNGKQQQRSSGQTRSSEELHDLAIEMHAQQSPRLNDWERDFLQSMSEWIDPFMLSGKQLATILKIHAKVSAHF
jgi:DNA anti-recombination protein RmuC